MTRDNWLWNSGSQHALVLFEGTTDADGRVELRGPGGRNLGVCVLGPGHVPVRQADVRLEVGAFRKGYRPRLRFSDDRGRTFPTDHLAAESLAGLHVADDGSYDVDGVPPGFWKAQVGAMVTNDRGAGGTSRSFADAGASQAQRASPVQAPLHKNPKPLMRS